MPHRFPDLAPPEPTSRRTVKLLQALPLGELCLCLLVGLALLLA